MKLAGFAVLWLSGMAQADDGEHVALRDVLGEAPAIVLGSAIDSARDGAFSETRFVVVEVLRGTMIASDTIIVRQPAESEEPLGPADDVLLLLDAITPSGAYPLHHPAGRYRVEAGESGDLVIVNASGVDGATISAKDLRPRAPDERISLDQFRALAGAPTTTHADASRARPSSPSPAIAPHTAPPTHVEVAPAPTHAPRWPWLAAAAVLAILGYGVRRGR